MSQDEAAPLPVSNPKNIPPNATVIKCLFPDGVVSKKSSQPGLTAACLALSKQWMQMILNQGALDRQNKKLAERLDRLEQIVLDHMKDGTIQPGLARTAYDMTRRLAMIEKQSSTFLLTANSATVFLKQYLPEFWSKTGRCPTEKEAEDALDAIVKNLIAEGDRAAQVSEKLQALSEKSVRCSMCVHWKEGGLIEVAGEKASARCEQPAVQLACPHCGRPCEEPIDPNAVTEIECKGCSQKFTRETIDGDFVRTNCRLFQPDRMRWRALLVTEQIPQDVVDEMFPEPIQVTGGAEPGDPGVAVPA